MISISIVLRFLFSVQVSGLVHLCGRVKLEVTVPPEHNELAYQGITGMYFSVNRHITLGLDYRFLA
ncbi:hypothetical protein [Candidatus Coxiella mudrowiae]|uniref:hypothetical protein n=1 Tax=Candidatus Coxiella mudrowiae TaxID=2054173 RepID=UPI0012FF0D5A|nr:hypothetical protein [Candidatus Coxiella mudrowiae]